MIRDNLKVTQHDQIIGIVPVNCWHSKLVIHEHEADKGYTN